MSDDLYILAATAVKRHGPILERSIVIEYALAQSREEAFKKAGQLIFERHFLAAVWRDPILKVESIPFPRVQRYRDELKIRDDSLTRLTFLWGYAIFYHESSSLECGTIIAQTKRIAEEGILLGPAKHTRGRTDFSLEKIRAGFILPQPPDREDHVNIFRGRFSDIIKE